MRALLEAGCTIDIFPIYPVDADLWPEVPPILGPDVFPRSRVHHLSLRDVLRSSVPNRVTRWRAVSGEAIRIEGSALRFGVGPVAKSTYAIAAAMRWARQFPAGSYDHVFSYWGNYAATAAYVYHRLTHAAVPFSMIVHARMDLYQHQVYLPQKMLYADNVFLVCEYNRGYIREKFPNEFPRLADRIQIHHLGLDFSDVSYRPDGRSSHRLLAVGRLERLKGYDRLLDAMALLARRGTRVTLDLLGGGEEESALKKLAATLGIADAVTFHGWVQPDAVLTAMQQATVLVHPPVTLDAMPTVIKEAIAVGLPVVASDVAGIPEILDQGRCGILVPAGDVNALADAIQSLVSDPERRRVLADAGRRHAERTFDLWANGRALAQRLESTRRPLPADGGR
jgi:glycosyltransferase involved in cell wall biosynthesis